MLTWFQIGQLVLGAAILGVVIERVYALHVREATSDDALRWLLAALEARAYEGPRRWAAQRPHAQLARLIQTALASEHEPGALRELVADLHERSAARLRLLRVGATLASTTGLLGGILTLAGGPSRELGLLALRAGAVERLTMEQAITTMAIGVAISALCFQALALLRPAAQKCVAQARSVARLLQAELPRSVG